MPLESLESFLERLRRYNSYTEKNWLQTLPHPLGQQPNLFRALKDFRYLTELTGVDIETLYSRTLHRFVPAYYLFDAWPTWPLEYDDLPAPLWEPGGLERYVHGQGHGKVCPLCWREQPVLLLPWSLRHITTCPIHRVFLVDHCSACRSPLTIALSSGTCEHCNYALDRLPVQILDTTEENEELSHLLWSAVGCGNSSFPPDFPTLAMNHPLRQVQPAAFLQFLWHGGQLLLTRDPQNPLLKGLLVPQGIADRHDDGPMLLRQAGVQTVHTVLLAMWHLLKGWPQSWYGLLERLVSQEEPLETTASTCLPAVFTSLFPGDAFAWLHRGWKDFMWQSQGNFVQLAFWQQYWESTPREKRSRHPHTKSNRAVMPIILPTHKEERRSSQEKIS